MTTRPMVAWALTTVLLAVTRAAVMVFKAGAVGGVSDDTLGGAIAGIASDAIHAGIFVWLAARSRLRDPGRLLALVGVGLGFVVVNDLEAIVFSIAPAWPLVRLATMGAVVQVVAAVVVAKLVPPRTDTTPARSPLGGFTVAGIVARVALLGLIYAVIYFVAGGAIYPFVREFYASKPLPAAGLLFGLQALVRGPLLVAIGALVISILRSSRSAHALAVAVTLAGLGGLTALLPPNPLFPDNVRLVHLAEVGISNAVFGWIVGWMLTPSRRRGGDIIAPGRGEGLTRSSAE
jgi:hypothetical protein